MRLTLPLPLRASPYTRNSVCKALVTPYHLLFLVYFLGRDNKAGINNRYEYTKHTAELIRTVTFHKSIIQNQEDALGGG